MIFHLKTKKILDDEYIIDCSFQNEFRQIDKLNKIESDCYEYSDSVNVLTEDSRLHLIIKDGEIVEKELPLTQDEINSEQKQAYQKAIREKYSRDDELKILREILAKIIHSLQIDVPEFDKYNSAIEMIFK